MQLYTNKFGEWERITKYPEEIKKFKSILKAELPMSFSSDTPLPVVLKTSPRYTVQFPRFVAHRAGDGQVGQVNAGPPSMTIPYMEKTTEDGFSVEWRISKRAPKITDKGVVWEKSGGAYRFSGTVSLNPVNDLELIIFLYFFSSEVTNSYRSSEVSNQNGRFEFVKADVAASIDFEKLKKDSRINSLIVDEATMLSYEELKKAAAIMHVPMSGIEKADRVTMYNQLQSNHAFNQFNRILDDIREKKKNPFDLSEINSKVKSAKSKGILREVDGKWCITSTEGDVKSIVVVVEGQKEKDKMFSLVEHLKTDTSAIEKINELLNEVEV